MGHVRIGRLPHSRKWDDVVAVLASTPRDAASISGAVLEASDERLRLLSRDPSVAYCFWVLVRLAQASQGDRFATEAAGLGVPLSENLSTVSFVARLSQRVSAELEGQTDSGHFREMAAQALRRSLVETAGQQGGDLFGSRSDEIREGFRRHAGADQFGRLTTRFFGDFLSRVIRNAVDRELSNHVGEGRAIRDAEGSAQFATGLDRYARESARIVQDFARDWYAKKQWHEKTEVSRADAQAFVGVALKKLRTELKLAGAAL